MKEICNKLYFLTDSLSSFLTNRTIGFSLSADIESTRIVVQPKRFPHKVSVNGLSPTNAVISPVKLCSSINVLATFVSGFAALKAIGKSVTFVTFSIYFGL